MRGYFWSMEKVRSNSLSVPLVDLELLSIERYYALVLREVAISNSPSAFIFAILNIELHLRFLCKRFYEYIPTA